MKAWIFFLLLACPALSGAAVYKWVDDLGHVHYGNVPPRQQPEYQQGGDRATPAYRKNAPKVADTPAADADNPDSKAGQDAQPQTKPQLSTEERMRRLRERILHNLQSTARGRQLLEKSAAEKTAVTATEPVIPDEPATSTTPAMTGETESDEDYAEDVPASEEQASAESDSGKVQGTDEGVDAAQHAAQMCGVFSGFVEDYKLRIKNECSGDACDVYHRQLEKYRTKQQHYCGQLAE
jgi:hypothetical protein